MALTDQVTDRIANRDLINLTNPRNPSASSIDTTRLARAATDVQGDFRIYARATYDDTDSAHVAVAVMGVVAKLKMYGGAGGDFAKEEHDSYIERLKNLSKSVGGGNRITPKSNSILVPNDDQIGTETARPWSDNRRFDEITPTSPAATDET